MANEEEKAKKPKVDVVGLCAGCPAFEYQTGSRDIPAMMSGECRMRPPSTNGTRWPLVSGKDWCFEHPDLDEPEASDGDG